MKWAAVLALIISTAGPSIARERPQRVHFAGTVRRGEIFEYGVGRDMVFRLKPNDEGGWDAGIIPGKRPDKDYAAVLFVDKKIPVHFAPSFLDPFPSIVGPVGEGGRIFRHSFFVKNEAQYAVIENCLKQNKDVPEKIRNNLGGFILEAAEIKMNGSGIESMKFDVEVSY